MNVDVGLQYVNAWIGGNGAAAIYNLMEDAATAEISRAQLWQWIQNEAKLADGHTVTKRMYQKIRDEELSRLTAGGPGHYREAAEVLDALVLSDGFTNFLTLLAYEYL